MAVGKISSLRASSAAPTRERILASAERLFAERGFDGVTMPMIAQASGITAGAIYKHFEGKADLFFQVVRAAVEAAPVTAGETPLPISALPAMVASYTERRLKRVRQMAIEMHAASTKDAQMREASCGVHWIRRSATSGRGWRRPRRPARWMRPWIPTLSPTRCS